MANELLDFVMSLVRDPDAAARYAADPGQAIADAHLTGVTSADVGNLLPMVSESLAMSTPLPPPISASLAPEGSHVGGSVWTSGAATAAFDAFTPHTAGIDDPGTPVIEVCRHTMTPLMGAQRHGITRPTGRTVTWIRVSTTSPSVLNCGYAELPAGDRRIPTHPLIP